MKDRLKEYIEKDEIYQKYKKSKLANASGFDKFCIQHCKDIEILLEENEELKKQLDYLRSGEYYNQLRFENEMLQQIVDTNGVPSEVYDYIDCTHRNTELLEQQQEFIKYMKHIIEELECDDVDDEEMRGYLFQRIDTFKEILQKYLEIIGNDINVGSKGVKDE